MVECALVVPRLMVLELADILFPWHNAVDSVFARPFPVRQRFAEHAYESCIATQAN